MPYGLLQHGATGLIVALDHSTNLAHRGTVIATDGRLALYDDAGNAWTRHTPFTLAPHDELRVTLPRQRR